MCDTLFLYDFKRVRKDEEDGEKNEIRGEKTKRLA